MSLPTLLGCIVRRNEDVRDLVAEVNPSLCRSAASKGDIQSSDFKLDTSNVGVGIDHVSL